METIFNWIKRGFGFFVLFILGIIFCFSFAGCNLKTSIPSQSEGETIQDYINGLKGNLHVTESISVAQALPKSLSFSTDKLSEESDEITNLLSVVLTATVLPETAENKLVDWQVVWGENATRADELVTDYVEVVPESDGSNIATVTCKKSFMGDTIYVIVTTRDGGYSATCTVSYVGKPYSMEVELYYCNFDEETQTYTKTDKVAYLYDEVYDEYIYEINSNSIVLVDYSFYTAFGETTAYKIPVIDGFLQNHYEYEAVGSKIMAAVVNEFGKVGELQEYALTDFVDVAEKTSLGSTEPPEYMSFSPRKMAPEGFDYYDLFIRAYKPLEACMEKPLFPMLGQSYLDEFYYVDETHKPYLKVTYGDEATGISTTFNVRIYGQVTDVNLDKTDIEF